MKKQKFGLGKLVALIVVVTVAALVALNWAWIRDFYRGKIYQPTAEMATIRESLDLTERGEFLFNASQPALNSEEDFNYNCQSMDDESAVLGCYVEYDIYVYNITEKKLAGIRELTTAHELLHAVYARLSVNERDRLRPELEKVYRANQEILKDEIEAYDTAEQLEEIYVRAGTEIKKLPDALEQHYAKIFRDQDKVVGYYDSYISVFRQLEAELDRLEKEMKDLNNTIDAKTREYESGASALEIEIDGFNNCANTAGCFGSEAEFNSRRSWLVGRVNALDSLYDEIDGLINQYNQKVEQYNSNVTQNNNLQNIINSHVKMEGI